ncbi:hypothetical protein [Fusobacterium ulcerans]|nr:hypothetical protein [Fusobacterium ulcerans]
MSRRGGEKNDPLKNGELGAVKVRLITIMRTLFLSKLNKIVLTFLENVKL